MKRTDRRKRLQDQMIDMLSRVEPDQLQRVKREFLAEVRRRKFRVIKGGRYEPDPDTLKGNCTL
jgi:hypothetical protein